MKRLVAPALTLSAMVLLLAGAAWAQTTQPGTNVAPAATTAAEAVAKVDSGDTAWMLASTALVLMMTVPGLALFYAGMVRKKNILATLMQSFTICCLVTIVWMVAGYSLTFTNGSGATAPFIGDLSRFFLNGIADHISKGIDAPFTLGAGSDNATAYTIPETVYMMYQMTFAIITPALIAGAFADRMKFSAMCVFMVLWSLIVYCPIAHSVWSATGYVGVTIGAIDFAGGTVVHINAGVAGLVCALVLGKRVGYGHDNMAAVQPDLRGDRRIPAVGRLVRLQRRVRCRRRRARWHGDGGDADRHGRRRRWPGCSPSGSPRASRPCWASSPAPSPAWSPSPRPPATCCRARP